MEHEARQTELLRTKLNERVSSLESDRRFLYEQKKSLMQKVQAMESEGLESKVIWSTVGIQTRMGRCGLHY